MFLCAAVLFLQLGTSNALVPSSARRFQQLTASSPSSSSSSSTALASVGSDLLQRPEDEDSPEFREYLKNLMKMQFNRAKSGFSAPSSGSSDAYVAKLNRLKIERQAMREAGLPDAPLDTSYKPEDYQAAMYVRAKVRERGPHLSPHSVPPSTTATSRRSRW